IAAGRAADEKWRAGAVADHVAVERVHRLLARSVLVGVTVLEREAVSGPVIQKYAALAGDYAAAEDRRYGDNHRHHHSVAVDRAEVGRVALGERSAGDIGRRLRAV